MLSIKKMLPVCIAVFIMMLLVGNNTAAAAGKPTIAVFDFTVGETVTGQISIQTGTSSGRLSLQGEYKTSLLTDKLVTALVKSKKVTVVERKKLASLEQEIQFTKSELADPNKAVKYGKLSGANYFLLGKLSMLEGNITYKKLPYNLGQQKTTELLAGADIRIVDTETGSIICAKSEKVKNVKKETNPTGTTNNIPVEFQDEVYNELVRKLVARVIDTLFPIKVAYFSNNIVYLNRGGLKEGAQYDVIIPGEVIRDPDTKEVLGQVETKFARITVTRSLEKLSQAKVIEWFGSEKTIPAGALCRVLLPEEGAGSEKQPAKSHK